MNVVPCACGCGETLTPRDDHGRPRRFRHGHHGRLGIPGLRGRPAWNRVLRERPLTRNEIAARHRARFAAVRESGPRVPCECGCGEPIPAVTALGQPARFKRGHTARVLPSIIAMRLTADAVRGARNPHWRGGRGKYGPEFNETLRRLIRMRDGYRCRRCGRSQEELGRTLHVHHLNHDKRNNDPSNLAAACGPCNTWASHHRALPFLPT